MLWIWKQKPKYLAKNYNNAENTMLPKGTKIKLIENNTKSSLYFSVGDIGVTLEDIEDTNCPVIVDFSRNPITYMDGIWKINPNEQFVRDFKGLFGKYEIIPDDGSPEQINYTKVPWGKVIGTQIQVSMDEKKWHDRVLYQYHPEQEHPFLCNEGEGNPKSAWTHGIITLKIGDIPTGY